MPLRDMCSATPQNGVNEAEPEAAMTPDRTAAIEHLARSHRRRMGGRGTRAAARA